MTARLFINTTQLSFPQKIGDSVELSPDDTHYVRDVLRLRAGEPLELGDANTGLVALTTIACLTPLVAVSFHSILESRSPTPCSFTLLCALLKGQKNDLVCDWATELGCSHIIFWQSSRSIVRIDNEKDRAHKELRLAKIATAAAQQSKQSKPPVVRITRSLSDAFDSFLASPTAQELRVVCSLASGSQPIRQMFSASPPTAPCIVAIGPEGDFAPEEHDFLVARGFIPISLGRRTLRSELAVVTALSLLGNR